MEIDLELSNAKNAIFAKKTLNKLRDTINTACEQSLLLEKHIQKIKQ